VNVQGKILTTDIDWILAQTGECSVCLTHAHIQMILTIVDYWNWPQRWASNIGTPVEQQFIDAITADLVRRLMLCCCDDNENRVYRFNEDGIYEYSDDGGTTWNDAPPSDDPRLGGTYLPPIVPGEEDDAQCIAANNLKNALKANADILIGDAGAWAAITALIPLVGQLLIYLGIGAVIPPLSILILALTAGLIIFGQAAFEAAMTTEVYDELLCIIYNHFDSAGNIDEAGWLALKDEIDTSFTGVAQLFLREQINILGIRGCNNAARTISSPQDECSCGEACGFDTSAEAGNWDRWELLDEDLYAWGVDLAFAEDGVRFYSNGYGFSPNQVTSFMTEFETPCFVEEVIATNLGTPDVQRMVIGYRVGGVWTTVLNEVAASHAGATPWVGVVGEVVDAIGLQYFDENAEIRTVSITP